MTHVDIFALETLLMVGRVLAPSLQTSMNSFYFSHNALWLLSPGLLMLAIFQIPKPECFLTGVSELYIMLFKKKKNSSKCLEAWGWVWVEEWRAIH